MRIQLPVFAAIILISVALSQSKGESSYLSLHQIGAFYIIGGGCQQQGSKTTTNFVFQVKVLVLRGERLRGRKEMKYLTVSTLNILKGTLYCFEFNSSTHYVH